MIFFASRRLLAAAELMLRLQHSVVMERERRATFVEVVRALPAGGAVVQFEAGAPLWAVWVPGETPDARAALRSAA
ncbi:hypothetical protein [Kitasatospora paracochleata]|uniref:Uncharacterized protein n=1 Tax=Kitasatospora paracochleata TaxID=58354 RepID=A0ABT1J0B5_9ACTN|nr:hypothetical protein [Kitasatospora paracochleata]MCP2310865.1 hypothetical protein [Kitasatospora paracochleata]MCP2314290.1 hypothetical protein [Kitasatospora paracochleata]